MEPEGQGFYRTFVWIAEGFTRVFLVLGVAFRVCAPVMEALTSVRVRAGIEDCMGTYPISWDLPLWGNRRLSLLNLG